MSKFTEKELDAYTDRAVSRILNPPQRSMERRPQIINKLLITAKQKKQSNIGR
jgi:hypothetical protein